MLLLPSGPKLPWFQPCLQQEQRLHRVMACRLSLKAAGSFPNLFSVRLGVLGFQTQSL